MNPFDTTGFPARWFCGPAWAEQPALGWAHIFSDIVICLAYYSVPLIVRYYVRQRPNLKLPPVFFLFIDLIFLTCGSGHLVEAIIFWWPIYKFSALVKISTAVVSSIGALVLFRVLPLALKLKTGAQYKAVEDQRDRLMRELQERNKELQQIVYVASHDLRSPLVNVQGFSRELTTAFEEIREVCEDDSMPSSLKERLKLPLREDAVEAIGFIQSSVEKMDTLMAGLLRISRLGRAAMTIETVDMNKLLKTVVDDFATQIRDADGNVSVDSPLPSCQADAVQINQVFANLIGNAIKYRHPDRSPIIRITGKQTDGQVEYCVTDNGIGMEPQEVSTIFELYKRLTPDHAEGEGVGLTVVKTIIDRLHGDVRVESTAGEGSRFYITLPAPAGSEGERKESV